MAVKHVRLVIHDEHWPEIDCHIFHASGRLEVRVSPYDTALSNFELPVRNALLYAVQQLFQERKEGLNARSFQNDEGVQKRDAAQRVEKRPEGEVTKTSDRDRVVGRTKSKSQKAKGKVR